MTETDHRLQIAQASRILYAKGVVDAFGHVSCRNPEQPDRFFMSRSMAPGLVTAGDVIEHNLEGEAVDDPGTRVFLERFIHCELYRARPDVQAVVHSHARSVVPFTVVATPLQPIAHTCGFLGSVGRPFDIADAAGPNSDLLVRDAGLGCALASHLGGGTVVLMRGHGYTTVGASIAEAVFHAVFTALNCEMLSTALQLGPPHYLSQGEAEACALATTSQVDRAWNLWIAEHGQL